MDSIPWSAANLVAQVGNVLNLPYRSFSNLRTVRTPTTLDNLEHFSYSRDLPTGKSAKQQAGKPALHRGSGFKARIRFRGNLSLSAAEMDGVRGIRMIPQMVDTIRYRVTTTAHGRFLLPPLAKSA